MEILLTSPDRWLIIIYFQWLGGGGCKSLTQLVGNDTIQGVLSPPTDCDRQHFSSKKPPVIYSKDYPEGLSTKKSIPPQAWIHAGAAGVSLLPPS